jgi:UDP-N-acetylglucosamine enolpyruvyl transferase
VGAGIETVEGHIHIKGPDLIESVDNKTMPYPGFPTDLQAQFMAGVRHVEDGVPLLDAQPQAIGVLKINQVHYYLVATVF